ncbi:MAG: DNA polymerase I [Treponema sp.]|nr:DNA polymerase I [Treponema sp.]
MDKSDKFDDKTVYILDSYGLIFRCYFAFISRPLTNRKGENVSALFGFFRNLHYVLQHYKPGYLIAAMDSKTKTFRHEMYDQYKATRNKTPDDLHAQVPWISDILTALGVKVLQCDGYEADDIIATVARKCEESGRTCRILSGDKDLMQLVTENTQILKPESGASTWKITGIEGVEAEWGVKPAQLLDLLSLYGDTADNIPGVHGIGVKTASKLLNEYQDLDGIYAHIDEIKGANQKKLIEGRENAYFSQKLVRLCNEVPCPDIDSAINSEPYTYDYSAAAKLLSGFDVPSVAKQYASLAVENGAKDCLPAQEAKDTSETIEAIEEVIQIKKNEGNYRAILTEKDLTSFIDSALASGSVAYDSETDSLDTISAKILGFSLSIKAGEAVYIPLEKESADLFSQSEGMPKSVAFKQLKRLFEKPDLNLIFHNAKFDLKVLVSNGLFASSQDLLNIKAHIQDTMLAAWLKNPDRTGKSGYSLEYLGDSVLGLHGIEYDEVVPKGQTFADVPLDQAVPYASEDADFTFQLWQKFATDMQNNELYNNIEMKILPILARMELEGIHLDTAFLKNYNLELTEGIKKIEQEIYSEVGHEFNIASPLQLQTVLFEERGLTPGKKTKRGYSTDTSVLEELSYVDKVPRMILEYREMAKLQSTYVETLPNLADKNSRIHTDFIQTGTATGRLSSRDPNLQNIPVRSEAGRRIRTAFTAPEGKVLISADYAQIELVVLAHLSGDPNMSRSFIEGTDVHKTTAALIYGVPVEAVTPEMRRTAKTINFGVIYGMSAFRLARDLEISRSQASAFITNYFNMYSSINDFINNTVHFAEENGYVETIFHRRRPIMNINSKNKLEKAGAERVAVNTPVQGSAADIVKKAMLSVSQALEEKKSPAKLLLQVHDELIFECPDQPQIIEETLSLIKDKMENAVKLNVPLRVSIEYGKNWGQFH